MRTPIIEQAGTSGSGVTSAAIIVVLVLMIGASIYLWKTGYARPRTAIITTMLLFIALIFVGFWIYKSGG